MKKLFILFAFITLSILNAQKVNIDELVDETQLSYEGEEDSNNLNLVWWIPIEYWEAIFKSDKTISDKEFNSIYEILKPYTIFAVADGNIGFFGAIDYKSKEDIGYTLKVHDSNNQIHYYLDDSELNNNTKNMLAILKPMISNMLGDLGSNIHFYVFDDYNKKGERIFNPKIKGSISVNFMGKKVEFKTPLSSLLPKKICPIDNEEFNGTYIYCPYHGNKLK